MLWPYQPVGPPPCESQVSYPKRQLYHRFRDDSLEPPGQARGVQGGGQAGAPGTETGRSFRVFRDLEGEGAGPPGCCRSDAVLLPVVLQEV